MISALLLAATIAFPPAPVDYVTDTAHALSAHATDSITNELRTYDQTTGNRVIVYIGQTTGDTPLEDWTIHAAETWKIFAKGKPDGAILFAFMQDHKVRIEVSYGLESALPDAAAFQIIHDTIVPKMREGDVDGAIGSGIDRMLLTITPSFRNRIGHQVEAAAPAQESSKSTFAVLVIFLIFIFAFTAFISAMTRRGRRSAWYWGGAGTGAWLGGGGGGGGFSGGGFSGGGGFGGGFGGGGASGGW